MANISLDNGLHFYDVDDIIDDKELQNEIVRYWDTLVEFMDEETRKEIHSELAPCTRIAFIVAYLEIAPFDLIIG